MFPVQISKLSKSKLINLVLKLIKVNKLANTEGSHLTLFHETFQQPSASFIFHRQ
jgi:hypothetical protein